MAGETEGDEKIRRRQFICCCRIFFELGEFFFFQNPVFKVAILWFWGILTLQHIVFCFEKFTYILW
jgi:hypothetical protein